MHVTMRSQKIHDNGGMQLVRYLLRFSICAVLISQIYLIVKVSFNNDEDGSIIMTTMMKSTSSSSSRLMTSTIATPNNKDKDDHSKSYKEHTIFEYDSDQQRQLDHYLKIFRQLREGSSTKLPFHLYGNSSSNNVTATTTAAAATTTTDHSHQQITLCTHLSINKLERLVLLAKRWNGPVSVAIYIQSEQDIHTLMHAFSSSLSTDHIIDNGDTHITHLFFEKLDPFYDDNGYPYNILRNMAVDNAKTPYVLSLDVDFMTQPNASSKLSSMLTGNQNQVSNLLKQERVALVLPAFVQQQARTTKRSSTTAALTIEQKLQQVPQTKQELISIGGAGDYTYGIAHKDLYPPCQRSTDYQRWLSQSRHEQPYYYIDYEWNYEPYVIVYVGDNNHSSSSKDDTTTTTATSSSIRLPPKYDESFRCCYGYDKSSWYMELILKGYQLAVLTDYFVIHLEHDGHDHDDNSEGDKRENNNNDPKQLLPGILQKRNPMLIGIEKYKKFRNYLRDSSKDWLDESMYQMIFQIPTNYLHLDYDNFKIGSNKTEDANHKGVYAIALFGCYTLFNEFFVFIVVSKTSEPKTCLLSFVW